MAHGLSCSATCGIFLDQALNSCTGYFVADEFDSKPGAPVFNRTVTLKDSYKPSV